MLPPPLGGGPPGGLLLLLPLGLCVGESTVADMSLRLELHWHVELEGVAVAVEAVALVELDFFLSCLLEIVAVLEHLFLVELLLAHVLRSADMPWMVVLHLHCLDVVVFH